MATQQEVNLRRTGVEHHAGLRNMVFVFRKLYTVALKCSWNHFISEKYIGVQSFKLHFLQSSPLVQLYTPASDCKNVGNIPGNHLVRAFPVPLSYSR
jgi:hypothetical protein